MMAHQQRPQGIPVRVHQTENHVVLAAPMPGLNPEDISVTVAGDTVTIRGEYRGPGQARRDLVVAEWTVGPYSRMIVLPQPVDGGLTNATYGNGVLVLSMPKIEGGHASCSAEFRLDVVEATRGQRVGHTGSDIRPTTTREHRRNMERMARGGRRGAESAAGERRRKAGRVRAPQRRAGAG